jgi:hypothetical protein
MSEPRESTDKAQRDKIRGIVRDKLNHQGCKGITEHLVKHFTEAHPKEAERIMRQAVSRVVAEQLREIASELEPAT